MAFKSEEKQIGEYTFRVNTPPYSVSQKILLKSKDLLLLKVGDTGTFGEDASPLSAAVFMDLDEDNLEFVINKFAEYSQVKQNGGEWLELSKQKEVVFAGNMDIMFMWLDFALETSFASFLDGLRNATKEQLGKVAGAQVSRSRKK